MKKLSFITGNREGMALPMVLWAIALLTAITLLLAGVINAWIGEETRSGKSFRARQQALSGLALALNPAIQPGDPLLKHGNKEEGWSVVIGDESGMINPNYFLTQKPDRRDILQKLFETWNVAPEDSESAADGLFDWQSASPFKSLRGAKKAEYDAVGRDGFPPGAPFVSPEEMELVIGFGPVVKAKPSWRHYFTTYYSGPVNLLHAPKDVLTDFLRFSASQADAWISLRNGKDGIEGTDDDVNPGSVEKVLALAGISPSSPQGILDTAAANIGGAIRRIESTGYCGGVSHRIVVVTGGSSGDNAQPSVYQGWSEE
jgi:hypothetical protein